MATFVASPLLGACGDDDGADGGTDASVDASADTFEGVDAFDAAFDAAVDPIVFPERTVPAPPVLRSLIADIGELGDADANGVRLAPGFTSRIIARSEEIVAGTDHEWHHFPDGGAVFATEDGGWIYTSNSELPLIGGVGAVRFDSSGAVTDAYSILEDTNANCAGGATPWHTWLSCEENNVGNVYETDPWGEHPAAVRAALGVFKHEAAAVDPVNWHIYLTEDQPDGAFYRFVPDGMNRLGFPELASGRLEVASVDGDGNVTWLLLPDPQQLGDTPTRMQVASTVFDGGEGIWHNEGTIYFSTKGDTRVWEYEISSAQLSVLYDGEAMVDPPLNGVDNLTMSCCGDILVAEDAGAMQIVAILPGGELKPVMQVVGQDSSEITGLAFDPSGTRLYFSSQRGVTGSGITFEIEGPFHEPA